MADINDELLHTKVHVEKSAPQKDLKRKKIEVEEPTEKKSKKDVSGLNLETIEKQDQENIKRNKLSNVHTQRSEALLHKIQSAELVNAVMNYVLKEELGGRHNSLRNTPHREIPDPCQLALERCTPPKVVEDIHYVVTPTVEEGLFFCEMIKQPVEDAERGVRGNRRVCDSRIDLVGGLLAGIPANKRNMLQQLITSALEGKRWVPPTPIVQSEETAPPQLDLFSSSGQQKEETMEDLLNVSTSSEEP